MRTRLLALTRGLSAMAMILTLTFNVSAQEAKSLLWEISGNGLEKSSYLYGTIHIICPDDFVISDNLKAAFEAAEQVALELDMDDPQEMQSIQMAMMAPGGVDYKGQMSAENYEKLDALVKSKMGVGMDMMKGMKPFGLLSVMYLTILDCAQPASYEGSFIQMAASQSKELWGLETGASQMAIFDNIPQKEQIQWIVDMMDEKEDSKGEFAKMVTRYKDQDLEGLYALMAESPEYAKYEDELLDNRNEAWIPKIGKLAKDKSTFIAVGAMHLPGDMGVINLLRKAGYTLKAMEN